MQLGRFLVNGWITQLIFVKSVLLCVHIVLKMMQCWRKQTESFNSPKQALVFTCLQYKSFENTEKTRNGS